MSAIADLKGAIAGISPRERRLIAIAAAVVAAGLLFVLGEWLLRERQRLSLAVPAAEARLARMQDQAEELARLKRGASPPEAAVQVRAAAARAAAEARGLQLELEELPDAVHVSGRAAAAPLLDWLAAMQSEQRLRPLELELRAKDRMLEIDGRLSAVGADGGR